MLSESCEDLRVSQNSFRFLLQKSSVIVEKLPQQGTASPQ